MAAARSTDSSIEQIRGAFLALLLLAGCVQTGGAGDREPSTAPQAPVRIAAPPLRPDRHLSPTLTGRAGAAVEAITREVQVARLRKDLAKIAARPRPAGSAAAGLAARDVHQRFLLAGARSEILTFTPLIPEVQEAGAELLLPTAYRAGHLEPALDTDFDTHALTTVPPGVRYAPDGDVEAQLVYLHEGRPRDLARLRASGIDPTGAIGLVRTQGTTSRGVCLRTAAEAGLVGLLFWADPLAGGPSAGAPWPEGRERPAEAILRGSGLDPLVNAGDPLTPSVPARSGNPRLSYDEARALPTIPAIDLSFADARPFLEQLSGPVAPPDWQAGLPFTVQLGGDGSARARITLRSEWAERPLRVVAARIEGTLHPEQWIVIGARLDSEGHGAATAASGACAVLETARVLGALANEGLRPLRTIVFVVFDGESAGALGSTEWLESLDPGQRERIAAWIDCDRGAALGDLTVHADPLWATQVTVALETTPPGTGSAARSAEERARALLEAARSPTPPTPEPRSLGDRVRLVTSPRTGFFGTGRIASQRHGIPLIEIGGTGAIPVAHSSYDTVAWLLKVGDPGLDAHDLLVRTTATIAWRIASDAVLGLDPFALSDWIAERLAPLPVGGAARRRFVEVDADFRRAALLAHERIAAAIARDPDPRTLAGLDLAIMRWFRATTPEPPDSAIPWARHRLVGPMRDAPGTPRFFPELVDPRGNLRTGEEFDRALEDLISWLAVLARRLESVAAEADRVGAAS